MPLFDSKVLCAAFLQLQFGFIIFWQKNIGAKAACKMLMKLTTAFPRTSPLMLRADLRKVRGCQRATPVLEVPLFSSQSSGNFSAVLRQGL